MSSRRKPIVPFASLAPYLGIFLLVTLFAVILQQIGAPLLTISAWMLSFGFGVYLYIAMSAKTMRFSTFRDADRQFSPPLVGMAIAAATITGNVFLLGPGETYFDATGFIIHFAATLLGLALATIMFSASLARSNAMTLSSLIFPQRSSRILITISSLIVIICSAALLFAQFKLIGLVMTSIFGLPAIAGIILMVAVAGIYLLLGGIQALGVARIVTYGGIIICLFVPLVWMSYQITGKIIPQVSFGTGALQSILEIDRELIEAGFADAEELADPLGAYRDAGFIEMALSIFALAGGIAAMPHLLQHFGTVSKGRQARKSGIWAFWLVALILSAVPAIAVFAKYSIYTSLLGLPVSEIEAEASWVFAASGGGNLPFVFICESLVASVAEVSAACGQGETGIIGISDITINPEFLAISAAMVTELPLILSLFLGLAAFFCIMATIDGLLLVIANSVTTDLYRRVFRPRSPAGIRLFMNRFFILLVIASAIWFYPKVTLGSGLLFAMAITLGCATLFPLLICRLWVPQYGDAELGIGMIGGLVVVASLYSFVIFGPNLVSFNSDELSLAAFEGGLGTSTLPFGAAGFACFWILAVVVNVLKAAGQRFLTKGDADATA